MVVAMIVVMIRLWHILMIRLWHIPVHNRGLAPAHSHHRGRRHQQSSPALHSTHRSLSVNPQPLYLAIRGPEHQMPNWTTTGYPDADKGERISSAIPTVLLCSRSSSRKWHCNEVALTYNLLDG